MAVIRARHFGCNVSWRSTSAKSGKITAMSAEGLRAAEQKMEDASHSDEAIRAFRGAYERLERGESGMVPTDELEPATDVSSLEELPERDPAGALEQFAVVKLNGGLATTMGLRSPKSLLRVIDRSFDIDQEPRDTSGPPENIAPEMAGPDDRRAAS